ncbi:MAG: hypothetical protein ACJA09_000217 [Alcanivorax sp.]|jgi:uncharacterized protein (DUF934 family)
MPKLIKNGGIVDDADRDILTLEQWVALDKKTDSAVQLEPGDLIAPLFEHLDELTLVAVNFPVFTDGRGFSYGRALRERGYTGELRAVGAFIRDQLDYLGRCGFNAFQLGNESQLPAALESLDQFSEHYQADIDEPLPLFRRRR